MGVLKLLRKKMGAGSRLLHKCISVSVGKEKKCFNRKPGRYSCLGVGFDKLYAVSQVFRGADTVHEVVPVLLLVTEQARLS